MKKSNQRAARANMDANEQWVRAQISQYQALHPRYQEFARTLHDILHRVARSRAPDAIVQTRVKSIVSFAEKIQRKRDKYNDPVHQFTDLCGARIITHTAEQVIAISKFIEQHFIVDEANSQDVLQRLKPAEFGYRSVHYIVQFKRDTHSAHELGEKIPDELFGLKAEIQVRTLLEHAWASFGHDRFYKSAFTIPAKWQRQLAELSAVLENADKDFARIEAGLASYEADYGAYLSDAEMDREIQHLEIVLAYDKQNVDLALTIGKLAITRERWDKAIDVLNEYANTNHQPLIKALGVALTKKFQETPHSKEFERGQEFLERASAREYHDADALASYASTWRKLDQAKMRELYRRAFETDPSDPYALNMFLQTEIAYRRDASLIGLMRSALDAAIVRCREQIEVGINMPWAYFNLGKFQLFLGQPYDALAAYTKGIEKTSAPWMLRSSFLAMNQLKDLDSALPGYEWTRRLLLVGWVVKIRQVESSLRAQLQNTLDAELAETLRQELNEMQKQHDEAEQWLKTCASANHTPIAEPVLIIAGGTDVRVEQEMQSYRELLLQAFADFHGTILSGGTTAGVAGLVGDLQEAYPSAVYTIGYVPDMSPPHVDQDYRYCQVRHTIGNDFSPLEPLQGWIDLLMSDISPMRVKLLGINGGAIAAIEYRAALALGATVGILGESGRAAARLAPDDAWNDSPRLILLPQDAMTLRAFVRPSPRPFDDKRRERLARHIHQEYLEQQRSSARQESPARNEWKKLPENFQESNRLQADDLIDKVRRLGLSVHPVSNRKIIRLKFTPQEIEQLAEMEHGRWNVERMVDGWHIGDEKDAAKKISPYLRKWSDLNEHIKQNDRDAVKKIPDLLAQVGLEVRRPEKNIATAKPPRRSRAPRRVATNTKKRNH